MREGVVMLGALTNVKLQAGPGLGQGAEAWSSGVGVAAHGDGEAVLRGEVDNTKSGRRFNSWHSESLPATTTGCCHYTNTIQEIRCKIDV